MEVYIGVSRTGFHSHLSGIAQKDATGKQKGLVGRALCDPKWIDLKHLKEWDDEREFEEQELCKRCLQRHLRYLDEQIQAIHSSLSLSMIAKLLLEGNLVLQVPAQAQPNLLEFPNRKSANGG